MLEGRHEVDIKVTEQGLRAVGHGGNAQNCLLLHNTRPSDGSGRKGMREEMVSPYFFSSSFVFFLFLVRIAEQLAHALEDGVEVRLEGLAAGTVAEIDQR